MNQNLNQHPAMNATFTVTEQDATPTSATLIIEPLEQGYGHTLGNALRRGLLSSLPGYAITKVKIQGVDHQFTTLEGLKEDITELILSLKEVRIKSETSVPAMLRLEVNVPREL